METRECRHTSVAYRTDMRHTFPGETTRNRKNYHMAVKRHRGGDNQNYAMQTSTRIKCFLKRSVQIALTQLLLSCRQPYFNIYGVIRGCIDSAQSHSSFVPQDVHHASLHKKQGLPCRFDTPFTRSGGSPAHVMYLVMSSLHQFTIIYCTDVCILCVYAEGTLRLKKWLAN